MAVVTHPRIYDPPSPMPITLAAVHAVLEQPGVHTLGEGTDHLDLLGDLVASGKCAGARVYDARVAAICLSAGVDALWSADRDFSWFPALRVINPLAGAGHVS